MRDMANNQNEKPSTITYSMTPEQERLYDKLDAQGGLSPDKIRAELGITETTPVSATHLSPPDETDTTVAKLERGSQYGPNRHIAPSDRDVEPWAAPPSLSSLPKPQNGEPTLWHSYGHMAATAALRAEREARQRAKAG